MTDIREKVARAINKADDEIEHFGTDAEINEALMKLADAVLLACRYHEMRAALEKIAALEVETVDQVCCGRGQIVTNSAGEPIHQDCCGQPLLRGEWIEIARAALGEDKP